MFEEKPIEARATIWLEFPTGQGAAIVKQILRYLIV